MKVLTQNQYLSDQIKVPLPKDANEIVQFKLIRAGLISPNRVDYKSGTKKVITPAGHWLARGYTINDPGANGTPILIQPIVGYSPKISKDGDVQHGQFDPIIEAPHFNNKGMITLTGDQSDLIIFMKLYPTNRDSPCRSKKAPLFYEVNELADAQIEIDNNKIIAQIMGMMYNATAANVGEFASVLKASGDKRFSRLSSTKPAELLRNDIYNLAKRYGPDMLQYFPENARMSIQHKINSLVKIDKLRFETGTRTWGIARDFGEAGKKKLAIIEPGNDPIDGLIDYCYEAKDGGEVFNTLKEEYAKCYDTVMN